MYVEFWFCVNGERKYSYQEYYDDKPLDEIQDEFDSLLSSYRTFEDADAYGDWHIIDDDEFFEKAYKLD